VISTNRFAAKTTRLDEIQANLVVATRHLVSASLKLAEITALDRNDE
jgi:hypothetical protein